MPVPFGDTDTASSSTLEVSDVTSCETSDRLEVNQVINSGRAAPPATVFLTAALLPERNLPNTRPDAQWHSRAAISRRPNSQAVWFDSSTSYL